MKEYLIVQLDKNIKKAKDELKQNNKTFYVYFESPFQYKYIGVDNLKEAKKIYNKIITDNDDLYGCVVSVECVN